MTLSKINHYSDQGAEVGETEKLKTYLTKDPLRKNFFWAIAGQALDLSDSEDRPPKLKLQAQSKEKVENRCMTGGLFQTDFIPHNDKSIADYVDELILILCYKNLYWPGNPATVCSWNQTICKSQKLWSWGPQSACFEVTGKNLFTDNCLQANNFQGSLRGYILEN